MEGTRITFVRKGCELDDMVVNPMLEPLGFQPEQW